MNIEKKKVLNKTKEALLDYCMLMLNENKEECINDNRNTIDEKLSAIRLLKSYYVDKQYYESAAKCRIIEQELLKLK